MPRNLPRSINSLNSGKVTILSMNPFVDPEFMSSFMTLLIAQAAAGRDTGLSDDQPTDSASGPERAQGGASRTEALEQRDFAQWLPQDLGRLERRVVHRQEQVRLPGLGSMRERPHPGTGVDPPVEVVRGDIRTERTSGLAA